jgi:hypothetical protein
MTLVRVGASKHTRAGRRGARSSSTGRGRPRTTRSTRRRRSRPPRGTRDQPQSPPAGLCRPEGLLHAMDVSVEVLLRPPSGRGARGDEVLVLARDEAVRAPRPLTHPTARPRLCGTSALGTIRGHNPVETRRNLSKVQGVAAAQKWPICREKAAASAQLRSACHAEGRGFESHQPLRRNRRASQVPALTITSRGVSCGPFLPVGVR